MGCGKEIVLLGTVCSVMQCWVFCLNLATWCHFGSCEDPMILLKVIGLLFLERQLFQFYHTITWGVVF